jgi:hypothetical protein
MSKKQLHILIGVLILVVVYLLFMPTKIQPPLVEPAVETGVQNIVATSSIETVSDIAPEVAESVIVEGLFLGLDEVETDFRKSFYYLLLDDGTEVVRIDLRPLLGYSVIDPITKLGVDRGVQVVIEGTMGTDGFVISKITPAPTVGE